jgi:serine/threonine protein kinase/WD40 repeat protein
MNASATDVFNIDPLISFSGDATAIADLAFGSLSRGPDSLAGRHLALLPAETLELDLSDPAQRQFGDYELLELIGEGGMGVVYRARQESLDREVAVKLLAAGPWASKEFIERFHREAQNAARMQHPNIVAIYEVGSAEELHFFSMRLIRGSSLAAVIRRDGLLACNRSAALLRTIAEAVDYAHRLGVLHLDLKPANVLIDENGNPHVADFGLARRMEQGLAADNNEVSGTPSYMAPEQAVAGAQKITPTTDIWGLGAVLYEMVTGQPPFLAESAQATLRLVVEGTLRSPRRLVPKLPRDLEAIILKCMARDVTARYATARALADDLGRLIEHRPVLARPLNRAQRTWRWARRQPYIAALGLLFTISMLVGIIGVTSQWRRAEQQRVLAEDNATISHRLGWRSRRESALRLQTDGKGFEALPLLVANIEEQEKAAGSADIERREFGMILDQGVRLIDRMIIPDARPITSALSADGSVLAIGLDDITVRWYDTATLTLRGQVDLSDLPTSDGTPRVPQLLRFVDNHRLRVTLEWLSFQTSPSGDNTYLVDLDRGKVVEPPEKFADLAQANFSADGAYALLYNNRAELQLWQVNPWRPLSDLRYVEHAFSLPWLLTRGGRISVTMNGSVSSPRWYDPHHLATAHALILPNGPVQAWQENNAGTQIAVGDSQGRVFLVEVATRATRQLPTPVGTGVTWLAYSEDDAWLAATRADGSVYAFDVASGETLHSGEMRQDFDVLYAAINHRDRLLLASGAGDSFASGAGDAAIWHLPQPGTDGVGAARLVASPTRSELAGQYWVGASLQAGLLATADMDGEVRLWRMPKDTELPAQGPPLTSAHVYFDGRHVVDVGYNELRVTTVGGEHATPWVELPQPIGFAALVDAGKTLVATSGAQLYVFEAASMRPRYGPLTLPGNPQRFAASSDGSRLFLSFAHNTRTGFEERILAYDLQTGTRRAGEASPKGPLRQLELSPDASRVLATGSAIGATDVFDAGTLRLLGTYPHDSSQPVLWASFTDDSRQLWLVTRDIDPTRGNDAMMFLWDVQTGQVLEQRKVAGIWPIGVTTIDKQPVMAARDRLIRNPGAPDERVSTRLFGGEPTTVFALSHDRRLLAHAYGRSVQLYDAATLESIGPPLATNNRSLDVVANLAFADDDRSLLGNSAGSRRWLLWPVAADVRNVGELHDEAELLAPAKRGEHVLRIASAGDRARLRARDPGQRSTEPRPPIAAARYIDGVPVPERDPHASPLLLDLTDFYNIAPGSLRSLIDTDLAVAVGLPLGVATLDGVDYDVRGALEMRFDAMNNNHAGRALRSEVGSVPVPPVPIAAVHVLLYAPDFVNASTEHVYATIRLHYRDGSEAVLPMRTQHEVPGGTGHDRPVPFGWVFGDYLVRGGGQRQQPFSNPRLSNPHPERIISSIDLATGEGMAEPILFAVTAEPVIPAVNSRIISEETDATRKRQPGRLQLK